MIDAVLSYHLDPETCGVAKFNTLLAQKLGVPLLGLAPHPHITPLISVKFSEFDVHAANSICWYRVFDLFTHDDAPTHVVDRARRVYDARDVGCPSTLTGDPTRGAYRVLTFGMSHKMLAPHFTQLKQRLDAEHPDYTIELSSAQHHGQSPTAHVENVLSLRAIFGSKLRVLGHLSDDALANELRDVDAVALYYTPALRANNTTAWAALDAGKQLYTNLDAQSPALDASAYSWAKLLERIRA